VLSGWPSGDRRPRCRRLRVSPWLETLGTVASRPSAGTLLLVTGEANIPFPVIPLLIITSTAVGTATLIGTVLFLSAWSPLFYLSEREHSLLRSEKDDEDLIL